MAPFEASANNPLTQRRNSEVGMDDTAWYVMRDLTRFRRGDSAYHMLRRMDFEVFTPMKSVQREGCRKGVMSEMPVLPDLLIVHSSRNELDSVLPMLPKLQYRYKIGAQRSLMIVPDKEMEIFMKATLNATSIDYLSPDEVAPSMIGKTVTITSGPLRGYEVTLAKVRGSKRKRIIVQLPGLLAARVELFLGEFMEIAR